MGLLNSVGTVGQIASGKNLIGGENGGIIGGAITNAGQYLGILDGVGMKDTFLDKYGITASNDKLVDQMDLDKSINNVGGVLEIYPDDGAVGHQGSLEHLMPNTEGQNINDIIKLPVWGYDDWINERSVWQKGLSSPFGEPAYFYFKVFFDFNTDYGLLGGLINRSHPMNTVNSAAKYLYLCRSNYKNYKIEDRLEALYKFGRTLSYININVPWFFKGVKGLDKADNPIMNDFSKEKTIELDLNAEAIDMKLISLLGLYKFACYDDVNHLEVIPENLRKFDMSILIFQTPIKYLHTAFKNGGLVDMAKSAIKGAITGDKTKQRDYFRYKTAYFDSSETSGIMNKGSNKYKNKYKDGFDNMMSFKLYSFSNCEIKIDSIGNAIPSSINNENPFQLGNSSITIEYDRVFTTQSNEFSRMVWGSTGEYFNKYAEIQNFGKQEQAKGKKSGTKFGNALSKVLGSNILGDEEDQVVKDDLQQQRYKAMQKIHSYTPFVPPQMEKEVIDASEKVMHNNLTMLSGMGFGNLYGQDSCVAIKDLIGGDRHTTDYWDQKINWLKSRKGHNNTSRDVIKAVSNILGTSDGANYRPVDVIGHSDTGIFKYTDKSGEYWKNKLKALVGGDYSGEGGQEGTASTRRNNVIKKADLSSKIKLQKPIKDMATKMKDGVKDYQSGDWTITGHAKTKERMGSYIDKERSNAFIDRFGEGIAKYGVGTEYWFSKIRNIQEANLTTEQKHYIQEEIENMATTIKDGTIDPGRSYTELIQSMSQKMKDGTLEPGRSYTELINEMAQKMKDGTLDPGRSYDELILAMATKMKSGTLEPGRSYIELIQAMAQKMKDGTLDPGRSYTELIAAMAQMMKDGTLEPGRSYTELIAAMAQKMKDGTLEPGRSYVELIQAMAEMMKNGTLEPGRSYTELIQAMAAMMKAGTLEPGRSYIELIAAMAEKMKNGTLEPGRSYTELIAAMAQMMKDGTLEPGRSYIELIQAMAQKMKDGTLEPGRSYVELIQAMAQKMKDGTLEPGRSYTELIEAMAAMIKNGTLEPGRSYTELIQAMAEIIKNGTLEPGRSYGDLLQAMAAIIKAGTLPKGESHSFDEMLEKILQSGLEPGASHIKELMEMAKKIKSGTLPDGDSEPRDIEKMLDNIKGILEPGRDHIEELQEMAEEIKKGTLN